MLFSENDCVWCGNSFETKEAHDKHYFECANESYIDLDKEESYGTIYNPNNY